MNGKFRFSDFIAYMLSAFIVMILIMLVVGLFTGEEEPDFRTACEDVGGSYEVIGQEFSPAVKMNVDIFGCVK